MVKSKRSYQYFLLIFAYILLYIFWWSYLLYKKNAQYYELLIENAKLEHEVSGSDQDFVTTEEYLEIADKYKRQRIMVVSEGVVFLLILIVVLNRVRKTFVKEVELANNQKNFLLSITHELKSPLATIKLSLQTLLKRQLTKEKQELIINNSLHDSDRLEGLVNNILFATKIQENEFKLANSPVDISEALKIVVQKVKLNDAKIQVESEIEPGIQVLGDTMAINSIFFNIIENALKYSKEAKKIKVSLKKKGQKALIAFEDYGIGIGDVDKSKVFDRFYRIGSEETRTTKGTGLGLYIVKKIVELHKGKVWVEDNVPKGSIFYVELNAFLK